MNKIQAKTFARKVSTDLELCVAEADINNVILLVVGVIEAIATLIAAIANLLLKKATASK